MCHLVILLPIILCSWCLVRISHLWMFKNKVLWLCLDGQIILNIQFLFFALAGVHNSCPSFLQNRVSNRITYLFVVFHFSVLWSSSLSLKFSKLTAFGSNRIRDSRRCLSFLTNKGDGLFLFDLVFRAEQSGKSGHYFLRNWWCFGYHRGLCFFLLRSFLNISIRQECTQARCSLLDWRLFWCFICLFPMLLLF